MNFRPLEDPEFLVLWCSSALCVYLGTWVNFDSINRILTCEEQEKLQTLHFLNSNKILSTEPHVIQLRGRAENKLEMKQLRF